MDKNRPLSKKRQDKRIRDLRIKLYAESHPTDSVRDLAKRFKVGKSTIAYAIKGRNGNKVVNNDQ